MFGSCLRPSIAVIYGIFPLSPTFRPWCFSGFKSATFPPALNAISNNSRQRYGPSSCPACIAPPDSCHISSPFSQTLTTLISGMLSPPHPPTIQGSFHSLHRNYEGGWCFVTSTGPRYGLTSSPCAVVYGFAMWTFVGVGAVCPPFWQGVVRLWRRCEYKRRMTWVVRRPTRVHQLFKLIMSSGPLPFIDYIPPQSPPISVRQCL